MTPMRQRFAGFLNRRRPDPDPAMSPDREPSEAGDERRRPVLVVGLGNPGGEYGNTRHNLGARCIALLARRHNATLERHGRIDRASIAIGGRALHLGRPRAFVNESGAPIAAELRRLALGPPQLLLIYDDLDLPVAQVRLRGRGGHGGNNGMKSIIDEVGSGDFARIRIGIDRPYDDGVPVRDPDRIADWVLAEPGAGERERLEAAVLVVAEAIEVAVRDGLEIAMNRFNRR